MLNAEQARELCYLVKVDDIKPIEGKDFTECAEIGGWTVMVRKGQFQPGSIGIYFEVDSKIPETEPFWFLKSKHYKIKTQKYKTPSGYFYSQGLLMHPEDFGFETYIDGDGTEYVHINGKSHCVEDETRFLTKELGVIYEEAGDNTRKANSDPNAKYKAMCARHAKLFRKPWARWMMKRNWGKKIMFFFFGKKKDKPNAWPSHICQRTDVERINNLPHIFEDKQPYVASEKVDGSSSSFAIERKGRGFKKYVCSRNVVFLAENQKCYYDTNIYFEMYYKYNIGDILERILNDYNLPNVAIQAEIFGSGVQKRDYSMKDGEREIRIFHIVSNGIKFPMDKVVEICDKYELPHVPILDDNYILPDTIEELQAYVEGEPSKIDGLDKEGIVFYDKATGQKYFKFVSPEFLLKYHNG